MRPWIRDARPASLRTALSGTLIVAACVLVPFGALAAWAAYGHDVRLPLPRAQLTDPYVPFALAGFWLPVAALVLAAGGVAVAARRRRALTAVALGTALGGAFLRTAVAAGRRLTLADVPRPHRPAAGAVYDTLTSALTTVSWALLGLGVLTAGVAWVAGRAARRQGCGTPGHGTRGRGRPGCGRRRVRGPVRRCARWGLPREALARPPALGPRRGPMRGSDRGPRRDRNRFLPSRRAPRAPIRRPTPPPGRDPRRPVPWPTPRPPPCARRHVVRDLRHGTHTTRPGTSPVPRRPIPVPVPPRSSPPP